MMHLTAAQTDRTAGVLLGQAIGDALGVPYEFESAPLTPGRAEMIGGGLGGFAPGEWSDDTAMAVCIARVSATGADLTGDDALEAVRVAVTERRLDVRAGLDLLPTDRCAAWEAWIVEAETRSPQDFNPNGYTVTALQAAWASIHATRATSGPDHVEHALQTAIAIGDDTDTVAAIAGALLGARYGVSELPTDLARRVHGWPGLRGRDLVGLVLATATRDAGAWPNRQTMRTGFNRPLAVPHPADPGVLLGTEADRDQLADPRATAVVSLSRVGTADITAAAAGPGKHVEVWLIDSDAADGNADLAWTLRDAARTVKRVRDEGETVLLHCVAAYHRTPSVALTYARLIGVDADTAAADIERTLGRRIGGHLWHTARTCPM